MLVIVFCGVLSGFVLGAISFFAYGLPLWLCILIYSFGGALFALLAAVALYFLSEANGKASGNASGNAPSPAPRNSGPNEAAKDAATQAR